MIVYKSLSPCRTSWYNEETKWSPGKWMPELEGGLSGTCGPGGYHFGTTIENALSYGRFPAMVWEAETAGTILGDDIFIVRSTGGRIVRLAHPYPTWLTKVNTFFKSINKVPWLQETQPPRAEWKMFDTRKEAHDAALDACIDIGAVSSMGDYVLDVTLVPSQEAGRGICVRSVWRSARDTTTSVASQAIRSTQQNNSSKHWMLGDAARDAGILASICACHDLFIEPWLIKHAQARWDVWMRGYGLVDDVGGVLYVYRKFANKGE